MEQKDKQVLQVLRNDQMEGMVQAQRMRKDLKERAKGTGRLTTNSWHWRAPFLFNNHVNLGPKALDNSQSSTIRPMVNRSLEMKV